MKVYTLFSHLSSILLYRQKYQKRLLKRRDDVKKEKTKMLIVRHRKRVSYRNPREFAVGLPDPRRLTSLIFGSAFFFLDSMSFVW